MERHRIKHLVTTQAAKSTGHVDFQQLAVGQMVRVLVARRQLGKAESIVTKYEKSAGKGDFTDGLRSTWKLPRARK